MALWMMPVGWRSRADEKAEKKAAAKARKRHVFAAVDKRDGMICRCGCGTRLLRTLELNPKRREHHHIIPVSQCGPTETWNLCNLAFACHERVTRHQMSIIGNADQTLTFVTDDKTWTSEATR